jgi:hypothetical protein
MFRPVHGFRGSFLVDRRPSVKSIDTRAAPAPNAARMSFSHSATRSSSNCSRGYPGTSSSSGYSSASIDGAMTACFIGFVAYFIDFASVSAA